MRVAAIIVAGGRGHRAGSGKPKQYRSLQGEPVLRHTLRAFNGHAEIGNIVTVIQHHDANDFHAAADGMEKCSASVFGGDTRQRSVFAGLKAIEPAAPEFVLVHDAARPFVTAALLDRALGAIKNADAAVPVLSLTDTVKRVDSSEHIVATLDRNELRTTQTPQVFSFAKLFDAHARAAEAGLEDFADDAAIAEWAGIPVATFPGEAGNLKLTTTNDFLIAEKMASTALWEVRNGTGFDVHTFGPGDKVTLGGITIPHTKSLVGHSDADVLLHALTDAILGSIGEADIGHHFPPSDPKWLGAASDQFLAHAVRLLKDRGGQITHLDTTLLCETPKIGPHREAMRSKIARIAGIEIDRIGVKATTTEGLGFIGRGEGIAAMATATVRLPSGSK